MKGRRFIDELIAMDIPGRIKADLAMLYKASRRVALAVLQFVRNHRHFGEAMVLGAVVAYLLNKIAVIGGFLALCALVTAAAIGLMRELHIALEQFFESVPA